MTPVIALSTGSVYPDTELGFRLAAEQGYDAVEVMVSHDKRSQTVDAVRKLSEDYGVPVRSVHVPCLVVTQHVWGFNPEIKLRRTVEMARALDAEIVVVHPPFRWQREYAAAFPALVDELHLAEGGPKVTVENMYTIEALGRRVDPYQCNDDPSYAPFGSLTLDTSHAGAARQDVVELYEQMRGRVDHLHLSDSTMMRGDEHLPPGTGVLPLDELAKAMVDDGFGGHVVLEVAIGRLPEASRGGVAAECRSFAAEVFDR